MTSAFTVAVECEGFLPLDPRDPENLDRKAAERDRVHNPGVKHKDDPEVEKRRKKWRSDAEKQRKDILAGLRQITKGTGAPKLVDETIREDGTAILYFEFDPAVEGDHYERTVEKRLDGNWDPKKGSVVPARRVATREPVEESKGDGAKTWDSAVRNEVSQARSAVVGAGLQVVECRVEGRPQGKLHEEAKKADSKETKVTDPGPSTHQETQRRSDEPSPEEVEQAQREEAQRQQEQAQSKTKRDRS